MTFFSCPEGFFGVRCQTLGSELNSSTSSASGKSSVNGTITAIVVVLVVIIVLIAAIVAAITIMRKRRRSEIHPFFGSVFRLFLVPASIDLNCITGILIIQG